jgi:hypothetical protein
MRKSCERGGCWRGDVRERATGRECGWSGLEREREECDET